MTFSNLSLALLSNLGVATLLAMLALAVTKTQRIPVFAQAMWVLVLLKLVTPPLWQIDLPSRMTKLLAIERQLPTSQILPSLNKSTLGNSQQPSSGPISPPLDSVQQDLVSLQNQPIQSVPESPVKAPKPNQLIEEVRSFIQKPQTLIGLWALGTFCGFTLVFRRVYRFNQTLTAAARPSRDFSKEATLVAKSLNLKAHASVYVVDSKLPPLLWFGLKEPHIYVPREFANQLSESERQIIFAHELAHFSRCDSWRRWFETLVVCVYWWFPVAWYARRQLQELEDPCCDAWTIRRLNNTSPKLYANLLLKTLDFVNQERPHPASPACEFGKTIHSIKQRFQMILQHTVKDRLTNTQWALVLCLAALSLPISARATANESEPLSIDSDKRALNSSDANTAAETGRNLLHTLLPSAAANKKPQEQLNRVTIPNDSIDGLISSGLETPESISSTKDKETTASKNGLDLDELGNVFADLNLDPAYREHYRQMNLEPLANDDSLIPFAFTFDYVGTPQPGLRRWNRVEKYVFTETYPNGLESRFRIFARTFVGEQKGVVAVKFTGEEQQTNSINRGGQLVFIPDISHPNPSCYFMKVSRGDTEWSRLASIDNVSGSQSTGSTAIVLLKEINDWKSVSGIPLQLAESRFLRSIFIDGSAVGEPGTLNLDLRVGSDSSVTSFALYSGHQSPIPPGQRALTAIPDLLPGKSTSITFAFKPNQTFTLVAIANPTSQTRNGTSFDLLVKLSDLQMVMSDSRPTEPKPDTIALWKDLVFPDQENTVRLISHSVVHYNGKLLSVAELSIELTQRIEKGNFDTLTIVAPPSIELSSFAAIVQLCTDVHIPHINVRTEDPAPLIKTQRH